VHRARYHTRSSPCATSIKLRFRRSSLHLSPPLSYLSLSLYVSGRPLFPFLPRTYYFRFLKSFFLSRLFALQVWHSLGCGGKSIAIQPHPQLPFHTPRLHRNSSSCRCCRIPHFACLGAKSCHRARLPFTTPITSKHNCHQCLQCPFLLILLSVSGRHLFPCLPRTYYFRLLIIFLSRLFALQV